MPHRKRFTGVALQPDGFYKASATYGVKKVEIRHVPTPGVAAMCHDALALNVSVKNHHLNFARSVWAPVIDMINEVLHLSASTCWLSCCISARLCRPVTRVDPSQCVCVLSVCRLTCAQHLRNAARLACSVRFRISKLSSKLTPCRWGTAKRTCAQVSFMSRITARCSSLASACCCWRACKCSQCVNVEYGAHALAAAAHGAAATVSTMHRFLQARARPG